MKSFFIFVFLLLLVRNGNAQNIIIKGKLVDADRLDPIVNASIKIGTTETFSNKLGVFSIQIYSDNLVANGIDVDAPGFQKFHLSKVNDSSFLYLTLLPLKSTYSDNVSVTFGGKDIIRRAFENLSKNYSIEPFNQSAVQFTQLHIDENSYILNNIAQLKFYNAGYTKKKPDFQTQILQSKQMLKDFPIEMKENDDALSWQPIGGTFELFAKSDAVLNSVDFLDTTKWKNYSYKLLSKKIWKGHSVYPVRFTTIDSTKSGREGIILIDSATYAVVKINMYYNWGSRREMAKQNKGSDFFHQSEVQYFFNGKTWQLESTHSEGYQIRPHKETIHRFDFLMDAINYPETYKSVEKIPFFNRVFSYTKAASFGYSGTEESWKPILDYVRSVDFKIQYPWLNLALFGF
ncbi:MAG: hypothetical protein DI598_02185 [Pseudopedobacter saltans]|uniref:Carboxypeptidase-like regulatory domain-containing protein n=1 Tax=Pseudopedobacter saltans TaxID=151895 RepID=A0A2W5F8Y3_9SPHI|nr:MAG: hypothetical protein DI598_02185 [Pseudopedobacter saltans]